MMGVQNLFFHKTHFVFLFKKFVFFFKVLWVSFFTLFGFTRKCLFRFQEKFITQKKIFNVILIQPQQIDQNNGNMSEVEDDNDAVEVEKEQSEPFLRFRFPTYEEFLENNSNSILYENSDDKFSHVENKEDYVDSEINVISKPCDEISIGEVIDEHVISSESEGINRKSNENCLDDDLHVENMVEDGDVCSEKDIHKISSNGEDSQQDGVSVVFGDVRGNLEEMKVGHGDEVSARVNDSINHENVVKTGSQFPIHEESLVNNENVMGNGSQFPIDEESLVNNENVMRNASQFRIDEDSLVNNENVIRNSSHYASDDDFLVSDNDSDSIGPSSESSFRSSIIDSLSDGFLSDIDFERAFEVDTSMEFGCDEVNLMKQALTEEDIELQNLSKGYEADDCDDEDEDILEELKNLESNLEGGKGNSIKKHEANRETETDSKQNEEKVSSGEQLSSDSDEQNGLETQWEHQDLVEQLKMEIKKVRAIGLPTILEESESPKITDDLKPWKIEEKYQRGGTVDDLQKFYKTYKERMRKLDILNYQKMYAIGFLRLKDPLQSFTKNKISTPALATIVSLDCWPCKPKSVTEIHQPVMRKFTKELESDLEMVYVGQMCLSWEFLRWQYGKALELWEIDPHGIHRYNEVADKFQTFQVLLTRFLEDEPFQGLRVQNFVKKRCVQRNLLQVPLIRDDNTRDRKKERKVLSSKDAITSLQLVETIEESIRILWRFIKTDKDTNNVVLLKCRRASKVELQNPADASLLGEIRSSLQKKEKKLKELTRSEKCILRKIQKHQEEEGSDVLYFFSQVDLRLVSRVLNMPRITTEQLIWCSDKLSNIHLVGRKLHVEPSVLLFPCS
ncbi:uncharacterized protein LOC104906207 [Beta vulgaris subsp. vulgaris]|uniref:uncharacterized protein LOC104906207 n=1 Tax=Beta vulgaris subsp. vulgaris TaxID=3555 RepID=UPI002036F9DA|nr:uncharacterized protein LOC104906207 [Beta vulgaris subsp. vulgaris]